MGIEMQRCIDCAQAVFPPRSMCPHCHSDVFAPATASRGAIEETTLQSGSPPILFGSIRTDLGPIVVAEIVGEGGAPGTEITLVSTNKRQTGGLIAVVPQPSIKEQ